MIHPFVRKLRHGARLTAADELHLAGLMHAVRQVEARSDIVAEGAPARTLPLIVEGWACRYKLLENGKRQIISLFIPGDLCEPFGVQPRHMDHPLSAITPVTIAALSPSAVKAAIADNDRLEEAFWWDLLLAAAIDREHLVSLGRLSAPERLAHLFCELYVRLARVGLADGLEYDLPVSQLDLSDLLGLSTVHVNRSLQELRRSGLISWRSGRLTIHDLPALQELSYFDETYLQGEGVILR